MATVEATLRAPELPRPADDGFEVTNPATGEVLALVPRRAPRRRASALEARRGGASRLARETAAERAAILRRWADLMLEHADDLALLLTLEQGKPLAEAPRRDRATRAAFVEWFAEEAQARLRRHDPGAPRRPAHPRRSSSRSASSPAITPWNFPSAMITRKVGAGAGRRLHDGAEAGRADAALRARARRARASAPACRAGVLNVVDAATPPTIGGELTLEPDRAQARLHRLDRGRQAADGASAPTR